MWPRFSGVFIVRDLTRQNGLITLLMGTDRGLSCRPPDPQFSILTDHQGSQNAILMFRFILISVGPVCQRGDSQDPARSQVQAHRNRLYRNQGTDRYSKALNNRLLRCSNHGHVSDGAIVFFPSWLFFK